MDRFAAGFGVEIHQPELIPNTRRALAITEYARDEGKLETFRDATMEAHWLRGQNIEEDQDLSELALEAGLDPDRALAAADDPAYLERIDSARREAHRRGVNGIPTFFLGELAVVGCQSYEYLAQMARRVGFSQR
jgi:predicted DsbA family dithiol-disulfide isomerase